MKNFVIIFITFIAQVAYSQDDAVLTVELLEPNKTIVDIIDKAYCKSIRCFESVQDIRIVEIDIYTDKTQNLIKFDINVHKNLYLDSMDIEFHKSEYKGGFYHKNYFVVVKKDVYESKLLELFFEKQKQSVNYKIVYGISNFSIQTYELNDDEIIFIESYCTSDIFKE